MTDQLRPTPALETVRVARGLTQKQLADLTGISQAALSKAESGANPLAADKVSVIAAALGCPTSLLGSAEAAQLTSAACVFHRKRANTSVSQAKQARCRLALTRVHAERLLDLVDAPETVLTRERPTEDEFVTPENIAQQLRASLGLPAGPLANLVETLEGAGAVVSAVDLGGRRLDALSDWVVGRRPVLMVNDAAPGDRQRFSLAHETGHAIMHDRPHESAETEADRFASELLMPTAAIRKDLERVTVERLLGLKEKWRVSAAALLRKGYDLGLVTEYHYRRLNMEMSAAGWRAGEPVPIDAEVPRRLSDALSTARQKFSDSVIAERVYLLPEQLDETFSSRRVA